MGVLCPQNFPIKLFDFLDDLRHNSLRLRCAKCTINKVVLHINDNKNLHSSPSILQRRLFANKVYRFTCFLVYTMPNNMDEVIFPSFSRFPILRVLLEGTGFSYNFDLNSPFEVWNYRSCPRSLYVIIEVWVIGKNFIQQKYGYKTGICTEPSVSLCQNQKLCIPSLHRWCHGSDNF